MSDQTVQEPRPVPQTDGNGGVPAAGTTPSTCPKCGAQVAASDAFCEICGQALAPTSAAPSDQPADAEAPIETSRSVQAPQDEHDN